MELNELIISIKESNCKQKFRDWLFGNSVDISSDVENNFETFFGDLRKVVCNNRNVANTFRAENNSNEYYPNVVICELNDIHNYCFTEATLFCKLLYLIFNDVIGIRYDANNNRNFISNSDLKLKVENKKTWECGSWYHIYKEYKFIKGEIIEKDLNIFEFEIDENSIKVMDIINSI